MNPDARTPGNHAHQQPLVLPFRDKRATNGFMVDKFKPAPGVTCLINQHIPVNVTSRQKNSKQSKKTPFHSTTVSPFSPDEPTAPLTPISIQNG